ncbi:MAG: NUDIX hydrolase, partial [Patescibacteria group bacterium]
MKSIIQPTYFSLEKTRSDSPKPSPLSKEIFDKVIQTWPRLCADVVIVDRKHKLLYLPLRKSNPTGYWFIGGSIVARESEWAAAIRKLRVETGLNITPDRLSLVWLKRYIFTFSDSLC